MEPARHLTVQEAETELHLAAAAAMEDAEEPFRAERRSPHRGTAPALPSR